MTCGGDNILCSVTTHTIPWHTKHMRASITFWHPRPFCLLYTMQRLPPVLFLTMHLSQFPCLLAQVNPPGWRLRESLLHAEEVIK